MSAEIPAAVTSLGLGVAGGYALARTGLYLPSTVRNTFDMSSYGLVKVVLSALGTAMVTQGIYSFVKPDEWKDTRSFSRPAKSCARLVAGGLVAGAGMALAGSTPFLLGTQLGSNVKSALTILGGSLVGGLLYAVAEKPLLNEESSPVEEFTTAIKGESPTTLDERFGVDYGVLAVPLGIALYAAALALEHFFPHSRDLVLRTGHVQIPAALPIVAGTLIGAAQVPTRVLTKSGVSNNNLISQLLGTLSLGNVAGKFRINSLGEASGLLLFAGSILGALFAQRRHPPQLLSAPGYDAQQSFIGGLLMAVGAALAGRCTGGQVLSGGTELAVSALVGSASALAGGAITTAVLRRA